MLRLHTLENSRSMRILWLLEELGLEYEEVHSTRDPQTMLGPTAQSDIHPLGGWPVLETDGLTLGESGAITEYLIEIAGEAGASWRIKGGDPAYPDYLYWLHFAEATIQPLLVMQLVLSRVAEKSPFLVRPVAGKITDAVSSLYTEPRVTRSLGHVEAHLSASDFFAADHPTGADVMMIFPLEAAMSRWPGAEDYPATAAYVRRIQSRPAYGRALEKGGRYDYAPL